MVPGASEEGLTGVALALAAVCKGGGLVGTPRRNRGSGAGSSGAKET